MANFLELFHQRLQYFLDLGSLVGARKIAGERFFHMQTFSRGSSRITFPAICVTGMKSVLFERGVRREEQVGTVPSVVWAMQFAGLDLDFDESRAYCGQEAIAARMALLSIVLPVEDPRDILRFYSSEWGCGFQAQCVGCGCVYVLAMGWSHVSFPFLREPPKVICPTCQPGSKP